MNAPSMIQQLERVDWNFADYNSAQFPTDINSLHWYPAAFVPQIPAILIKCLSKEGDVVFDAFSGSGTTIIEASRLRRRFIGIDRNPHAINICKAKLTAIGEAEGWFKEEEAAVRSLDLIEDPDEYCRTLRIDSEIKRWFERNTLAEILTIHRHVLRERGTRANNLRQVILSSILNRCCSQRDHYTYITDRCFPKQMFPRAAREMYCGQVRLVSLAVAETRRQFARVHGIEWSPFDDGIVECHDARRITWLDRGAVDIVVTSPPYLGVNDYVRSMRLTSLLFPADGEDEAIDDEIGARRKRHRSQALDEYKEDMSKVFAEIARVLKQNGYLAMVIGQGKGRVNRGDVLEMLIGMLASEHGFRVEFQKERRIKFRRIQVPGVGTERIVVLRRRRGV